MHVYTLACMDACSCVLVCNVVNACICVYIYMYNMYVGMRVRTCEHNVCMHVSMLVKYACVYVRLHVCMCMHMCTLVRM